jgi:lipopolysaccharide transport system ATP-binding protein
MATTVISVENISKMYRLGEIGTGSFYGDVKSWWARRRGISVPVRDVGGAARTANPNGILWALRDVSFSIKQGETIGIIGNNGAGKSTLLKILSHLTAPTRGEVRMRGRIASLLEVGTGFHPELTGRENIFLNSAILGMSRRDTQRKFDEIVAFSGVEDFIDTPVKHYSSGMYVRLAFSVAAHLDSDILVLDEVLAVGDAEFQRKCLEKIADVALNSRTILFVSHNLASVRRLCERSIWIDRGVLKQDGTTHDVILSYTGKTEADTSGMKVWEQGIANRGINEFQFLSVRVLNAHNEVTANPESCEPFFVEIRYRINQPLSNCRVGIVLSSDNGTAIFDSNDNDYDHSLDVREPGEYIARCEIPGNLLNSGNYYLSINAGMPYVKNLAWIENIMLLKIEDTSVGSQRFVDKRDGFLKPDKFTWKWSRLGHD